MNPSMKKAIVGFFAICAAIFFGLAVYFAIRQKDTAVIVFFAAIGALSLLPILPAVNRRVLFFEEEFVYRTWLGREHRFRYSDVRYYTLGDHDLYLYTAGKRMIIDRDVEEAEPMKQRLDARGIPGRKPVDLSAISDDAGETPQAVYYRKQRVTVAVIMLSMAGVFIVLLVLLTIFVPVRTKADRYSLIGLYIFCGVGTLYLVGLAMYSLNGRVEIYRNHFVYRTWLGKRREYAYSDCVSKKVKEYRNRMSDKNRIYTATIRMKDGSRVRVDNRMLEDGLAASLNFRHLPKE